MDNNDHCKAVINILASCISRDIFTYQNDNGGYRISKYSNVCNLFHITGEPAAIDNEMYNNLDISHIMNNFEKRCLFLDLTKNTLNYIKEEKSDYLIVDSAMCRFKLRKVGNSYIASNVFRDRVLSLLREKNLLTEDVGDEIILTGEMMEEPLLHFSEEILKMYKPENIILIDIQGSFFHDNDSLLSSFANCEALKDQNVRMREGFQILKKYLNGCHVIPMLDAIASDTNHWLKVAPLHFTKEYYEYAFKCIEIISQNLSRETENEQIANLHSSYSDLYFHKYYDELAVSFSTTNEKLKYTQIVSESRDLQAKFFKSLLIKKIDIVDFFMFHKCKSVIIYGWTRVSEFIISALKDTDIKIVCIIEDMKLNRIGGHIVQGGFEVISKSADIPETDCIFIANLYRKADVNKKLSNYKKKC